MAKTIDEYKAEITKALKNAKTYSKGLDLQIMSLASAMRSLEMANAEIDGLSCTTVWEQTRYGQKLAQHPVFKTQKEAQASITTQMKALGLTVEDLVGDSEDDPLTEMTKKLIKKRSKSTILKPDNANK